MAVRGQEDTGAFTDEGLREHIRRTGTVPDEVIQQLVAKIVAEVRPLKIILFGSAARGDMKADSDIDILVVGKGHDRRDTARRLYRKLRDFALPKDIVVVSPDLLEKYRDVPGYVYRPALREGKVIYAR